MDSDTASNMPAWSSAVPAASVPQGLTGGAINILCNSRSVVCPCRNPNIPWGTTSSERTWGHRPSRWFREQEKQASRCSVRNRPPMNKPSVGCSAGWSGRGVRPIPTTTMQRGASKRVARKSSSGKPAKATRPPGGAKLCAERTQAAHRKSLHGRKVHQLVAVGDTVITEKISYNGWQKQYGRSVGLRAPGMFIAMLRRTVASTGGTLHEVPTRTTKLSQFCHGCGRHVKKLLSQRWHHCPCGVWPVQRDLYSAFLASTLSADHLIPSCAQAVVPWESAEARLQAAHARVLQRANEGQCLHRPHGRPPCRSPSASKSGRSHTRT
jgi:hypothetical protein